MTVNPRRRADISYARGPRNSLTPAKVFLFGTDGCNMAMKKRQPKPVELTLANLHDAHDDDERKGKQFASGEHILHPGGPPDAGAVHPCEQH